MMNVLASLGSRLTCSGDECLSFIIVFLNLLTIFFLVYSSYRRVGKFTIIFGYFWSSFIMITSIIVLIIHTCIFTLGATLFTAMAIVAVLSMIWDYKKSDANLRSGRMGCYVIFPTDDHKFVFGLHNNHNKLLALSSYKYNSVEEAKDDIRLIKQVTEKVLLEDLTKSWILDVNHPKFKMFKKDENYYFTFELEERLTMLKSNSFIDSNACHRTANQAVKCLKTDILYLSSSENDLQKGSDFLQKITVKKEDAKEEVVEEKPVIINKVTLYEYLDGKYGKAVLLNRRKNETTTGLLVADTYYTYNNENKSICFAYVSEDKEHCTVLLRLDKETAKKYHLTFSRFPKSNQKDWYKIVVDSSFDGKQVLMLLDKSKEYCDNK